MPTDMSKQTHQTVTQMHQIIENYISDIECSSLLSLYKVKQKELIT